MISRNAFRSEVHFGHSCWQTAWVYDFYSVFEYIDLNICSGTVVAMSQGVDHSLAQGFLRKFRSFIPSHVLYDVFHIDLG